MSDLALYEYKRHVVGLIVRVHSDGSNDNQFRMKAKKMLLRKRGALTQTRKRPGAA